MSNLKELQDQLKKAIDPKTVFEQNVKKQKQYLGTLRLEKGHKLFSLDIDGNVEPVELNGKVTLDIKGKKIRHQLNVTDKVYAPALNKKNAIKRFVRMGLIDKKEDSAF